MALSGIARASQSLADDEFVPGNILITGGAGFIGSNVVTRLVENYPQYKVILSRGTGSVRIKFPQFELRTTSSTSAHTFFA
jgi:nucleoside-diphosphate-sugar epimerase